MSGICITAHAAQRYVERVNPGLTPMQAMNAIHRHDAVIRKAAAFGCSFVRLGCGSRLVLDHTTVVTVLSREWRQLPVKAFTPRVTLPEIAA